MTSNLTRKEAQERARLLTLDTYRVSLDVSGAPNRDIPTYDSVTTVTFTAAEDATTFIDIIAESVYAVSINGQDLNPAEAFDGFRVTFPVTAGRNELTVGAKALYSRSGEGMHRFFDPADDKVYLYTQYEPTDARRVFANFDQPDLKAVFEFEVTAPSDFTVLSGGAVQHSEEVAKDITRHSFAPTLRQSSYITCVCAGHYVELTDSYTRAGAGENGADLTIPLGLYARASLADHMDPESIFTVTKQGLDFFMDFFDYPYPWGKYDQIFVPEYNLGAMENPGLVTFTDDYLFRDAVTRRQLEGRANVILHEMAHMWFGDLATMTWWDDLWLKESFADYMGGLALAEATEFDDGWVSFALSRKDWAYRQDQYPTTHPIVADIPDVEAAKLNFDGITYAKGASVLKQLVAYVGRENFFRGVKSYFDKHAWSNTRLADLLAELEAASGRDLARWTRMWIQESGVNILRPQYEDEDGLLTELTVVQQPCVLPGHEVPSLRPHRLGVGLYSVREGRLKRTALHEIDVDGEAAEVPVDEGTPVPDLIVVNDGDLTYAKVRLDERGLETVRTHFGDLNDSLTQLVVLGSVWDMARDAEIPVTDYISLVCDNLEHLVHSTGLQTHLRQLETAVFSYTPPALRGGASERTAEALWTAAASAPKGSDQQFQFLRGFVSFAQSEEQLKLLAQLLSGEQPLPEGQKLDEELRWHMLTALAGHNRAGEDDIESTLQADNTAAGQRSAARARASVPTSAAKTAAFRALTEDNGLPNAVLSATARGFAAGLQEPDGSLITAEAPLQDFAAEYFDRAEDWWATRTLEIAQTLTLWLFPPATETTVAKAEQWLEEHAESNRGLQRIMVENLDRARRALAVQRRSEQP